ncbi:MAG: hypothetical protein R2838_19855 [Caldilineaceae bacterium]
MRDVALTRWRGRRNCPSPTSRGDYEFVALRHPDEYAMNEGRLIPNCLTSTWPTSSEHIHEEHVAHSTALHAHINGRDSNGAHVNGGGHYLVGPLARYSLNYDKPSPIAQDAARAAGLGPTCDNLFQSIVVRAVETLYAVDEALRILESWVYPELAAIPTRCAPRGPCRHRGAAGILYHRYRRRRGRSHRAGIVPPTAQNQPPSRTTPFMCPAASPAAQ